MCMLHNYKVRLHYESRQSSACRKLHFFNRLIHTKFKALVTMVKYEAYWSLLAVYYTHAIIAFWLSKYLTMYNLKRFLNPDTILSTQKSLMIEFFSPEIWSKLFIRTRMLFKIFNQIIA